MRLKDVERRPHHGPAPEDFGQAGLVPRVDEVHFEVRDVADVVAVERDALAEHDVGDVLRRLSLFVLGRQRDPHRLVQRRAEASNIVADCRRVCTSCRSQPRPSRVLVGKIDLPEVGSSLPLYST